jgi:hypothetical protein
VVSLTLRPLNSRRKIGSWVGPRAGLDDVEGRIILPLPKLEL